MRIQSEMSEEEREKEKGEQSLFEEDEEDDTKTEIGRRSRRWIASWSSTSQTQIIKSESNESRGVSCRLGLG